MRQVSANLSSLLGLSPQEVLGRSFETVVGAQTFEAFQSQIRAEDFLSPSLLQLSVKSSGSEMQCVAHRHDGMLIVELEPAPEPVGRCALRDYGRPVASYLSPMRGLTLKIRYRRNACHEDISAETPT